LVRRRTGCDIIYSRGETIKGSAAEVNDENEQAKDGNNVFRPVNGPHQSIRN
jgi:hypothetical protein